jgi:signal transduction histidine kinase
MNRFVSRAIRKIDQMDTKQIITIINNLDGDVRMLEAVLDSLQEGLILCKNDRSVVYANGKCQQMIPMFLPARWGYEGMAFRDVVDDKEMIAYVEACLKTTSRDDAKEFDYPWGGGVRTISVRVVESDELKNNSFLVIFTDVTEKNQASARLHQSEYLASMTTMAASIAHEIKNPLAAMSIHLQLLKKLFVRKGSLTMDDAKRYIDVLDEEIDRLNSIVVDFLFAVRPMTTVLKLGDLSTVVEDVIQFVSPEISEQQMTIRMERKGFIPQVEFDEKLIKQVLLNLVKNAMNAMKPGGNVTVTLELDGDNLLCKVTDTGCGIPPENLSKIFEPYFTTKSTGTGLGLTVVYKVMKEHHGDVRVESKVGVGACFTLVFPVPASQRMSLPKKNEVSLPDAGFEVKE